MIEWMAECNLDAKNQILSAFYHNCAKSRRLCSLCAPQEVRSTHQQKAPMPRRCVQWLVAPKIAAWILASAYHYSAEEGVWGEFLLASAVFLVVLPKCPCSQPFRINPCLWSTRVPTFYRPKNALPPPAQWCTPEWPPACRPNQTNCRPPAPPKIFRGDAPAHFSKK